ncbi:MAG: hypothetical protein A4S14_01010 [Proteobacteria bacterium SG_bin9]|nr:MAG: hypothetical protein A4S14_01010 [Proteobacteria bacterium SG_bin9]
MVRCRSLHLVFALVLPILLTAWGSALARPCLMDPSTKSDCCDGLMCSPSCAIGCQSTVTPERPVSVVRFDASAVVGAAAVNELVGIDIAPDVPPPR